MKRRGLLPALALLACTGAALGLSFAPTVKPFKAQASKPKPAGGANEAPDFTLTDVDGKTVNLSDYRGKKVVILDFWATWCGPCRAAMPLIQSYYEKNKGKVEVLSINEQETPDRVAAFIKQTGYTYRVLLDRDGKVESAYRVYGIPTLFVVDKDGDLRHKSVGYRPDLEQQLTEIITPLP